jgi:ribonuclease HII
MKKENKRYLIWVDEAGRWAWAGPVVAWAFCVEIDFDFSLFPGLTDSKKLSPQKREMLLEIIEKLASDGKCYFSWWESSAATIDTVGIREANRRAMEMALKGVLKKFSIPNTDFKVLIDGRDNYAFEGIVKEKITYIVRWDLTEPVISAASIVAKVKRDRIMCDFSADCPEYGFSHHKGYGTKKHHESLLYYGIHTLHRKSYAPIKALISEKA